MTALDWVFFVGSLAASGVIGYLIRVAQVEAREFAAEQVRDDAWDREHGIGR